MKYRLLRAFMKRNSLSRSYDYANNTLVIDGNCFKDAYKMSGCQFILGGEYDRFANSLKNILRMYINSGIECYVVFNGAGQSDMERRKYVHQKIINKTDAIIPGATYEYCQPIFVKEVYRDVLNELKIKNFTCVNGSTKVLFDLAKKLKCPILSNNIEYTFYGVSVIEFRSVVYHEETHSIKCKIYFDHICRKWCPISMDLMSILLTITNEDSAFYDELPKIISRKPENYIPSIIHWIRRQSKDTAVEIFLKNLQEENRKIFIDQVAELRKLFVKYPYSPIVDCILYGHPDQKYHQGYVSDKQFERAVSNGIIAQPFINLKTIGLLSGSWVVYNKDRDDSMLVAADIALYAQALLTNSTKAKLTFICRKGSVCHVSELEKTFNIKNEERKVTKDKQYDHFYDFIKEHLPGFDLSTLEAVPEDSWILLISLLYYNKKTEINIENVVYSVILSYVLLGPVSEKIGLIKRNNFPGITYKEDEAGKNNAIENSLTYEQCSKTADAVMNLFYVNESALKINFDRDTLHTLAEFQYCLQFINYLNRLCGEKIICTKYHKAINCTFIYNVFVALKDETNSKDYINSLLQCTTVYLYFNNIVDTYFKCATFF